MLRLKEALFLFDQELKNHLVRFGNLLLKAAVVF